MNKVKDFIKKYIPVWVRISIILLAAALVIYIISVMSVSFADFINGTLSLALRYVTAKITYFLPFSLFELIIILILPAVVFLVILSFKAGVDRRVRVRGIFTAVGIICLLYSSYILMLGVGYRTTALAKRIDISESADISKEELYRVTLLVRDEVNNLSVQVSSDGKQSEMEYDIKELSRRLCQSYSSVENKYPFFNNFDSRVKPIIFSGVMSDMGITGIYSYFTGEPNVNMAYPDYNLPYTAAHELAHQRGICRENEANFMAFLVCTESSDPYIRYSGYLSMYEYLSSALYYTDKELYRSTLLGLSDIAYSDMLASAEVTREHSDSLLNRIMDKVNDLYLKSNGTEGIVSYGYVVRLAVAYYS